MHAVAIEGIKSIGFAANHMDITIGINTRCKYVLNIFTKLFCQELMDEDVKGYIPTNRDKTVAALLTEAIQEAGIDRLIKIKERFIYVDELIVIEGHKIKTGYINKVFLSSNHKNNATASNNNIVLTTACLIDCDVL